MGHGVHPAVYPSAGAPDGQPSNPTPPEEPGEAEARFKRMLLLAIGYSRMCTLAGLATAAMWGLLGLSVTESLLSLGPYYGILFASMFWSLGTGGAGGVALPSFLYWRASAKVGRKFGIPLRFWQSYRSLRRALLPSRSSPKGSPTPKFTFVNGLRRDYDTLKTNWSYIWTSPRRLYYLFVWTVSLPVSVAVATYLPSKGQFLFYPWGFDIGLVLFNGSLVASTFVFAFASASVYLFLPCEMLRKSAAEYAREFKVAQPAADFPL